MRGVISSFCACITECETNIKSTDRMSAFFIAIVFLQRYVFKMFMQNLEAVQLHVFAYRISAVCGKTFKRTLYFVR